MMPATKVLLVVLAGVMGEETWGFDFQEDAMPAAHDAVSSGNPAEPWLPW